MHIFKYRVRTLVLAVTAAVAMTTIAPMASYASSEGNRNTAIGLAGVGAYLLAKGKTLPGIAAVAGAGYAYSRSQSERQTDRYRDNRYRNDRRSEQYRDNRDWRSTGYYRGLANYQYQASRQSYNNSRDARHYDARYDRGRTDRGYRR